MKVPGPVLAGVAIGLIAFLAGGGDDDPSDVDGRDTDPVSDERTTDDGTTGSGSDDTSDRGAGSGGGAERGSNGTGSASGADAGSTDTAPADTGATGALDWPSPPPSPPADQRGIVLTFDDGPHPTHTPQVLDLLEAHDATAVFCLVGEQARRHPGLVRRIVNEGHILCNHTWSHDHELGSRTHAVIDAEVSDTLAALNDAVPGADVVYLRQPGTFVTPNVSAVAREYGLEPLNWTVDPRDWSRPGPAVIASRVLAGAEPGAVVLLHDGGGDRAQTVQALSHILDALDAAGYQPQALRRQN